MTQCGFFTVERSWFDHPCLDGIIERGIWLTILERAAWRPTVGTINGTSFQLEPGQCLFSVFAMAREAGISHKRMRTILEKFRAQLGLSWGNAKGKACLILNISSCREISHPVEAGGKAKGKDGAKPGQTMILVERIKEGKKEERLSPTEPAQPEPIQAQQEPAAPAALVSPPKPERQKAEQDPAFDQFWKTYPRKVDKGHARKAWRAAVKRADPEVIQQGLDRMLRAGLFAKDAQYVPHPSTWLNGERWADELKLAPKPALSTASARPPEVILLAEAGRRAERELIEKGKSPFNPANEALLASLTSRFAEELRSVG